MAKITPTRAQEMLNDLEDYELDWDKFETDFLTTMKDNLDKYDDKFKFFGNQEATLQRIYDKYIKEVDRS